MDANETRFQLLLGYENWGNCTDCSHGRPLRELWEEASPPDSDITGLAWDHSRNELTLRPRLFQFPAAQRDNPPKLSDRRGAGRDRYGNWYWIDETRREIRVNSVGTGKTSHFWSVGDGLECPPSDAVSPGAFQARETTPPPPRLQLSGLAVAEDHYLVVGVLDPPGLLIFDLYAGGSPRQVFWPRQVKFAPFDMAPKPGGGVWILDHDNMRYWAMDRHFNIIREDQGTVSEQPDDFQPTNGGLIRRSTRRTPPEGFSLKTTSSPPISNPIAIEALPDDSVLILDNKLGEKDSGVGVSLGETLSHIYRYRFGEQLGQPVSIDEAEGQSIAAGD